MPPVSPMLAKSVSSIPPGASYEPKWDGFRSICFRDGDEVELGSRNERPMTRYFPELVAAAIAELPDRCVIDGEIIIATDGGLDFEALQQRMHPAASRVRMLAEQTPASFIAFDLLALGDDDYTQRPFSERRAALVDALAGVGPSIHVTPATTDLATAQRWFSEFEGAGLDGVVAKPLTSPYQPDKRVMFKIKHERTADCVVAGYRLHKSGAGRDRLADARALQGRRHARVGRRDRRLPDGHGGGSCSSNCSHSSPHSTAIRGTGPPTSPASARRAGTRARGGTRARTCRSSRCGPSGSSRSATTTWRAKGSATQRSSTAGVPTASRARARTRSSSSR